MSIEVQLSKLTDTLEKNTDALNQVFGLWSNSLKAGTAPAAAAAVPVGVSVAVKSGRPKAEKAAPAPVPAPAPAPAATPDPEADFDFDAPDETPAKKLTVDDARKALVALQKAKGSAEASRGILKANGLASLAALKDDQQELIAKIIASVEAALKA